MTTRRFTSESVSAGHPDKLADQISDAILDAILKKDKHAHVACETLVKENLMVLAGEIKTTEQIKLDELESVARDTAVAIGYDDDDVGFDGRSCRIINELGEQSPDISQGVDRANEEEQGAGDQGMMFGYASNEIDALMPDVLMPAPITYAHRLMQKHAEIRRSGQLPWLRPDAKSQMTFIYEDGKPVGIHNVVLSAQHDSDVSQKVLEEAVMELIIKPTLPERWIHDTEYHINPTGRFVTGGPAGDCGLTGRKIIVDTYGGMARHGGGAFSGKDPSKVDRSAAYACRYVAKNIVAAGLAERCEVQVSYAIGVAKPTSVSVDTFGTGKLADDKIATIVKDVFDLRPHGIITMLDLLKPIYQATAAYGHFGRNEDGFRWERTDKASELRAHAF